MDTPLRINEIFYSLQGEGHHAGRPAVFVRFAGCNLSCPFCDTNHSAATDYTLSQLIAEVEALSPVRRVIFTGGEPSLQLTQDIIDSFHTHGYTIHVETNGTRALPQGIDWVTCSPKYALPAIDHIDEVKVVFDGSEDNLRLIGECAAIEAADYRLQPCDVPDDSERQRILRDTIAYTLANPKWSLSLQTHKLLGLR